MGWLPLHYMVLPNNHLIGLLLEGVDGEIQVGYYLCKQKMMSFSWHDLNLQANSTVVPPNQNVNKAE
jgi:hypothetical protein